MIHLIHKVKGTLQRIVTKLQKNALYLIERLRDHFNTHPVDNGLVYTNEEENIIDQTADLLSNIFSNNPGTVLLQEDFESRCEAIEDFGNGLAQLYQLEDAGIVITDDNEIFSSEEGVLCFGYATLQSSNKIYINANILRMDDPSMLEHIVSTVIHEMRHLMQRQIASLQNTWGTSYERRHLWRYNIAHYIDSNEDFRAYQEQPIEWDARNFTNRVWLKSYQHNIAD